MNNKIFFEWSNSLVISNLILGIIFIVVFIICIRNLSFDDPFSVWGGKMITMIIISGVTIAFLFSTPLYVSYNEEGVIIKKIIGSKKFPQSEICSLVKIDTKTIAGSTRKMGSGGIGGYIGLFYNKQLGNYYMHVTIKKDLVLLETNQKKYVFNCKIRDELIDFAQTNYNTKCKSDLED